MGLTKEQRNIIAYRLVTIGELRVMDIISYQLSEVEDKKIAFSTDSSLKVKGRDTLIVTNEKLEGIRIEGVSIDSLGDGYTIVTVTVNVDEDPDTNYEVQFLVGDEQETGKETYTKLTVIEED